jgi:uncharacterized protein with HEPN domain
VPPRDWRLRLKDIEQSIDRIATYIKGFDYEIFSRDRRTVDAVIHNIQVIGEAAIALPDSITKRYPTVPWANIRAMRHILVHGYLPSTSRSCGPQQSIAFPSCGASCDVLQNRGGD